jgi:NAD(P)-dependent dehydrogenase (short-subunit alcohol dehydrogenase family)
MKSVVITGVSSGIGWGTAKILVQKGFHVLGSVRKIEDAERLTGELGQDGFTPLLFDVTDESAVREAAEKVRHVLKGETLFGLVNNAGIAVPGPLVHLSVDEYRHQLDVNLISPLIVTQAFFPLLGGDPSLKGKAGRIINISSVGGKMAWPFLGAYNASKFGLEGFSESLRRELMLYGIDVIVVAPGPVATAIWDKAETTDLSAYHRTDYVTSMNNFQNYAIERGRQGYSSERVGEAIHKALTTEKPKVRYAVVPKPLSNWWLPRLLPKRILDRIVAKNFGLTSKK